MKLFLASTNITTELQPYFLNLVGKEFTDIKFALIENAADPYPEEKKGFVYETRNDFEALGMQLERIDLREFIAHPKNILEALKKFDVIWLGGGNVFYLRWVLKASGFDAIITEFLKADVVYGGGSAGAIVAGPVLDKFDLADDISKSPELLTKGLGLTTLTVLPHWGHEKYQAKLQEIKDHYDKTDHEIITLSDQQAILVNGDSWKIYP